MLSETYQKGNYTVIKFLKVLHLTSNILELETIVDNRLKENRINIAIHFKEGSYLCSQTGAVLVRCWENIKDHEGDLTLINVNKDIHDFLTVIDFDSQIKIYDSEEELLPEEASP